MNHWYSENEYVKVRSCHFVHDVVDAGLFMLKRGTIIRIRIHWAPGYLEPTETMLLLL